MDVIFDKDTAQGVHPFFVYLTHQKFMVIAVISITSHGGFLGALLKFVGHPGWRLLTGGKFPVFVRFYLE